MMLLDCTIGADMIDPEHPILKEIRRRKKVREEPVLEEGKSTRLKRPPLEPFVLWGPETPRQRAQKAAKFIGTLHPRYRRNRRTVELAEIEGQLRQGKHVQNRTLQNKLTEKEYAVIDTLWQQQKKMRASAASKPKSVKDYEAWLKRAAFYDTKARGEEQRGRYLAAARSKSACIQELQQLYDYAASEIKNDPTFATWLDRPLPADRSSLSLDNMPRSITSTATTTKRMSIHDCKLAAVRMALEPLLKLDD